MEPWAPSPKNRVLRASGRFLSLKNGILKIDFLKAKSTQTRKEIAMESHCPADTEKHESNTDTWLEMQIEDKGLK